MQPVATELFTVTDYRAMPEGPPYYQLIEGELIVSPWNGALDKKRKRPLYARHGVKELWLIEPALEQIHRYDFTVDAAKPVRIVDREEHFETPLLPGLVVSAVEVFKR